MLNHVKSHGISPIFERAANVPNVPHVPQDMQGFMQVSSPRLRWGNHEKLKKNCRYQQKPGLQMIWVLTMRDYNQRFGWLLINSFKHDDWTIKNVGVTVKHKVC
jgi:hypothetical protein